MEASFDNAFPAKTDNRVKRMYVQEKRNMICSKDFRFFCFIFTRGRSEKQALGAKLDGHADAIHKVRSGYVPMK